MSKNEEWAEIFKELMMEIDKLKKEVAYISERNIKLVELYVEGETKDVWDELKVQKFYIKCITNDKWFSIYIFKYTSFILIHSFKFTNY